MSNDNYSYLSLIIKQGIRDFLKEQGLNHERGKPFPQDVSSADLERFRTEGISAGPKLASKSDGTVMHLEGKKSAAASEWNARAVSVLSTELHRKLQEGKVENVRYETTMNVKFCEKQIKRRLDIVRRERIAHDEDRLQAEQERNHQIERRRSRRKSVSPFRDCRGS